MTDNESDWEFYPQPIQIKPASFSFKFAECACVATGNVTANRSDLFEVEDGDAAIEGVVAADNHSYVMRSGESQNNGPYVLTTAEYTGVQAGEIQGRCF